MLQESRLDLHPHQDTDMPLTRPLFEILLFSSPAFENPYLTLIKGEQNIKTFKMVCTSSLHQSHNS